jgi:putative transposase
MMKYQFIAEHAHEHRVRLMCEVLGASRSGYHKFCQGRVSQRVEANVRILEHIKTIHTESRGTYGSPRVHRELKRRGLACGRHRTARLMATAGIVGRARQRFRTTTKQRKSAIASPDLLKRDFSAERPHEVWTSDITYIWTDEGWLYLAVILDLCTRAVVGWATGARIYAELVCSALTRALSRYRPDWNLIMHSDRGSQYTSELFRKLLKKQPVPLEQSNGLSCFDNAVTESFFHSLKTELVSFERYHSLRGRAPVLVRVHRSVLQPQPSPLLDRLRPPDGEAGGIFKKSSLTAWSTETGEL